MPSESCKFNKGLSLAEAVLAEEGSRLFKQPVLALKEHEIRVVRIIFDKAATDCDEPDDSGLCCRANIVNHACSLIFGAPSVELSAITEGEIGFRPQ